MITKSSSYINKLNHLGLLPDGNRRWAVQHGLSLTEAYSQTVYKLSNFIDIAFSSIAELQSFSIYFVSRQNLNRSTTEIEPLFVSGIKFIDEFIIKIIDKHRLRFRWVGYQDINQSQFIECDQYLVKHFFNSMYRIENYSNKFMNKQVFALLGYDPLVELKHVLATENISHLDISSFFVPYNIDLVIRPGGHQRLSGFLPIQCSYAEFLFREALFPDYQEQTFIEDCYSFKTRHRNYGL